MTTVSDDFNRADETPLAGNWTESSASADNALFNLTSNQSVPASLPGDACAFYNAASFSADQASRANLTVSGTSGGGSGIGLSVRRATAATATYYRFVADHAASTNCNLQRFAAGAFTSLDTFTQSWTDGALWELRVVGPAGAAVLTVYLNGTQVRTFTDNSTVSSGSPGLAYSSTVTSAAIDNWTGTDSFDTGVNTPSFQAIPFMAAPASAG